MRNAILAHPKKFSSPLPLKVVTKRIVKIQARQKTIFAKRCLNKNKDIIPQKQEQFAATLCLKIINKYFEVEKLRYRKIMFFLTF